MYFEFINIYILSIFSVFYILLNVKNLKKLEQNKPELNGRVYFFDFIKGISIFAVIIMHIAYFYTASENFNLAILNIFFVKLFRFAVPIFIISSGALLSLKNFSIESIKEFYKTKFFRVFIPYIIACVIIGILNYRNLSAFFSDFIFGDISIPFYFITILLQLYLLYPILKLIILKIGKTKALILSFMLSFISAIFFHKIGRVYFSFEYLFYFMFGMILKEYFYSNLIEVLHKIKFIKFSILILILYFAIGSLNLFEIYSNFQVIYSIVLFLILLYFNSKLEKYKFYKLFVFLGKNSLYIFLYHFLIMQIFNIYIKILFANSYTGYFILFVLSIVFGLFLPALVGEIINRTTKALSSK